MSDKVPLFYKGEGEGKTKPIKIPGKLLPKQNLKTLKSVDEFRKKIEENDSVAEHGKYVAKNSSTLAARIKKEIEEQKGIDKTWRDSIRAGGKTQKRRKHKRSTQKRKKARKTKRSTA